MHGGTSGARRRTCLGPVCAWLEDRMPRVFPSRAREETRESRGMPCLFLNTERVFGRKTTQKSGFRRHLAGSKMPKEGSKMPKVKLPRFRGHRTIWVRGVHDGQDKSS